MDTFTPRKLLCIAAHPDDVEFCIAGSIIRWVEQGCEVNYLICTDGSKGTVDTTTTPEQVRKTRQQEQRDAAKVLDVKEVSFLDHCDSELECNLDLKQEITGYIRRLKPDTVHCMDPSFFYSVDHNYINHSDHRVVGQATLDAVYPLARDGGNFPDQVKRFGTHKVRTLLMTNLTEHNMEVDITDHFETKLQALLAHRSQIPNSDEEAATTFFKKLNGSADGYSEKFVRLDLRP